MSFFLLITFDIINVIFCQADFRIVEPVPESSDLTTAAIDRTTEKLSAKLVSGQKGGVVSSLVADFPEKPMPPFDPNARDIRMCVMMERSTALFYDYTRVAAAIDLGLEQINKGVLLKGFKVQQYYKNMGSTCSKKNDAVKYALQVYTSGITCHVYLGPGERS